MTYAELKAHYPNASEEFLRINADCGSQAYSVPERAVREKPVAPAAGEDSNLPGIVVRIVGFRQRLLDPDNLCPKYFIDGLRYAGLIPDDSPDQITLEVRQEKVAFKSDERTEIEITYEP